MVQCMVFHLFECDWEGVWQLVVALVEGLENIGECEVCWMLLEDFECWICVLFEWDVGLLCVVELLVDVIVIEEVGIFCGCYFVLQGCLLLLDGVGLDELGLSLFED